MKMLPLLLVGLLVGNFVCASQKGDYSPHDIINDQIKTALKIYSFVKPQDRDYRHCNCYYTWQQQEAFRQYAQKLDDHTHGWDMGDHRQRRKIDLDAIHIQYLKDLANVRHEKAQKELIASWVTAYEKQKSENI